MVKPDTCTQNYFYNDFTLIVKQKKTLQCSGCYFKCMHVNGQDSILKQFSLWKIRIKLTTTPILWVKEEYKVVIIQSLSFILSHVCTDNILHAHI